MEVVTRMEAMSKPKAEGQRRPRAGSEDDWIRNQLQRVYDATIREDIPSEMMDLLRQLDEATAGHSDDGRPDDAAENGR